MPTELKENGGIPSALLYTLAAIAGISVANLYYNQPLLNMIREDLGVTEFQANLLPMLTQIGYAAGLLFIIPLGDLFHRKKIISMNFIILVVSLLGVGVAQNIHIMLMASLLTGICSVIPQFFIPIAAQFSTPETKGKNVGIVLSGLLTGILASRVISGFVGELWGWREMYFAASALMLVCGAVILKVLPDIRPTFDGKYASLMKSLFSLVREFPMLRVCAVRAAFAFGSFLAMWACMAFKLKEAPFYAGSDVVGLLGLCGIAGALTASTVGKYIRRVGVRRFNFIGCALILLAWCCLWLGGNSYAGLVAGIVIIDIGMQCIQLSNQTTVFSLCPGASNRINTIFMTTYFIGGSLGTFLAGSFWQLFAWHGVVGVGFAMAFCSLVITMCTKR